MSMLGWCATGHHGYTDSTPPGLCPGKVRSVGNRVPPCDCDCHTNAAFVRPRMPDGTTIAEAAEDRP